MGIDKIPQDIPAPENREGQKMEWGKDLGQIPDHRVEEEIQKLNAELAEGEKPWRLPTKDELEAEFKKAGSTLASFQSSFYLSSTVGSVKNGFFYAVHMGDGRVSYDSKYLKKLNVRVVR